MSDEEKPSVEQLPDMAAHGAVDTGDFFGPNIQEQTDLATKARDASGDRSAEYAAALVALGDAYCVAGSGGLNLALANYQNALQIFEALKQSSIYSADAHHRIASVFRRLKRHEFSVHHLQQAIDILALSEFDGDRDGDRDRNRDGDRDSDRDDDDDNRDRDGDRVGDRDPGWHIDYLERLRSELSELQTSCINQHSSRSIGRPPL